MIRGRGLLGLVGGKGGLILGVFFLRGLIRFFCPRQLLMLNNYFSQELVVSQSWGGRQGSRRGGAAMVEQTHHSLSETLHCQDYVTSHMYSVEVLDASAASCRTLAGGVKSGSADAVQGGATV